MMVSLTECTRSISGLGTVSARRPVGLLNSLFERLSRGLSGFNHVIR